jgi:hypothetical protein
MQGQNGGPKTTAGKARSRANAVKHGLRAASPVVQQIETEAAWKQHVEGVVDSLEPDGYLEEEMAMRIAGILWRLRRVNIYESQHISLALDRLPDEIASSRQIDAIYHKTPEELTVERIEKLTGVRLLPTDYAADNVMRYETHLHRLYIQTLHELEAIQARRHGERTPLARLDITGSPA